HGVVFRRAHGEGSIDLGRREGGERRLALLQGADDAVEAWQLGHCGQTLLGFLRNGEWRNGEWRMVSRALRSGCASIPHSPFALLPLLLQLGIEAPEHAARIALEDARLVVGADGERIDVALGVIVVVPCPGVDAP